ncbi:Vomeronasal type-1 receptor 3 [Tupaia chinensis]|uniref:Vomeronasal type-1 receptor n=1 Tax=Tupaia chinensis TaxID=246437 RepID=L8YEU3_TUPCH|nr:Vomeronasal type-1 receptor 3 [Tupaia chinensis]
MVGNLTVFVNYAWAFLLDAEKKAVHVILVQLTFTNIILIFTKAMSQVLVAFGVENFLHDVGCKIVIYLRRVARSLSMCSYSLLTVVQALTISPRDSVWGRHQPKAARHILPCLLLFSVFCSLVNMHVLYTITNTSKNGSREIHGNHYCRFLPQSQVTQWVIVIVMALHDVLFLGFTGVASGYMVFLLHKHHKHALYLQSTKRVYTTPPEIKAAQSVLLLMLCFLLFYWTDSIITLSVNYAVKNNSILILVQELLVLGHAILSPFVMIYRDRRLTECWHICKT